MHQVIWLSLIIPFGLSSARVQASALECRKLSPSENLGRWLMTCPNIPFNGEDSLSFYTNDLGAKFVLTSGKDEKTLCIDPEGDLGVEGHVQLPIWEGYFRDFVTTHSGYRILYFNEIKSMKLAVDCHW